MLRKETWHQSTGKTLANLLSSTAFFQSIYSVSFCLMPELEKSGVYDLGLRITLGYQRELMYFFSLALKVIPKSVFIKS